jgi:hypothetical protein
MGGLTTRVDDLAKLSRQAAVMSAIGFAILGGSVIASAWYAHRAETHAALQEAKAAAADIEYANAKLNLDSLVEQVKVKDKELEDRTRKLADLTRELDDRTRALDAVKAVAAKAPSNALSKDIVRAAKGSTSARPSTSSTELPATNTPLAAPPSGQVKLSLTPTGATFNGRPVYDVRCWMSMNEDAKRGVLKVEYFFDHPSFVPNTMASFAADKDFAISYRGYGCVPATATIVSVDGRRTPVPFDMCSLWKNAKPPAQ